MRCEDAGLHLDEDLAGAQRRDHLHDAQARRAARRARPPRRGAQQRDEPLRCEGTRTTPRGPSATPRTSGLEPRGAKPALVLRDPFDHRVTEDERRSVSDLLARGEALAAESVESTQRGEQPRAAAAERAIAILARVVRGRIEAVRAERAASEREQRATETEASARQARGALERAAERRMVIERDIERAQQAQQAQQQAPPQAQPEPQAAPTRPAVRPAATRPRASAGGAR
jgi:hypothetical protein